MTETSPAGANIPANRPDLRGSIGLPLPGILMDVVALDDPRRVLPPGEIGEIRIKGPNVTRGYWNRPEETAAAFVDGYLLTGDIGYMDADGFFFLIDRKKDMIISGGFNVYPRMIEEAIYEHPGGRGGRSSSAFPTPIAARPPRPSSSSRRARARSRSRRCATSSPTSSAATSCRRRSSSATRLPKTAVGKLSKKELVAEEQARAAARTRTGLDLTTRCA